ASGPDQAHAAPLGGTTRNGPSDAGNLRRLTENLAALFPDAPHRRFDVIHPDDDRRVLRRPVGLLREESAIDGAGGSTRLYIRLGSGDEHIVAHIGAEHLRLPAESLFVKPRHASSIFRRHFKVNDGAHRDHDGGSLSKRSIGWTHKSG